MKKTAILFDLPTFPKGVVSLSLLKVAAVLTCDFEVKINDLNLISFDKYLSEMEEADLYGLKVSSQNVKFAISLTNHIKERKGNAIVIWGGELPSLMPDYCLQYADTVIGGLFESVAPVFLNDYNQGQLQRKYFGENTQPSSRLSIPFGLINNGKAYYNFMGLPLETSRGCTEKCIFCMVHTMQKKHYHLFQIEDIDNCLLQYKGSFINLIDYNFGVDAKHVIEISKAIKRSGAIGWMAEMCIDLLDNDEMLAAMQASYCKMIYCGLETINQDSLRSVHKMNTNHIENYERIIRKVQSYGIQVGAGIILGLEGTNQYTLRELNSFFHRMGIIYAKLTFLTYNPGTKVHEYEKRRGQYLTDEIACYDGNQLTFLPNGVEKSDVIAGAIWFIKNFYSVKGIIARSFQTKLTFWNRLEFILFNLCYRDVYLKWIKFDTLHKPLNLEQLIESTFSKSLLLKVADWLLLFVRKNQLKTNREKFY